MRKMFTHVMLGSCIGVPGANTDGPVILWKMQEDIEVIGFELHVDINNLLNNDGMVYGETYLTQGAASDQDAVLGFVNCLHFWNTAPAAVGARPEFLVMWYPEGKSIQIKEEGALYLYGAAFANLLPAGAHTVTYRAHVYYCKGIGK